MVRLYHRRWEFPFNWLVTALAALATGPAQASAPGGDGLPAVPYQVDCPDTTGAVWGEFAVYDSGSRLWVDYDTRRVLYVGGAGQLGLLADAPDAAATRKLREMVDAMVASRHVFTTDELRMVMGAFAEDNTPAQVVDLDPQFACMKGFR